MGVGDPCLVRFISLSPWQFQKFWRQVMRNDEMTLSTTENTTSSFPPLLHVRCNVLCFDLAALTFPPTADCLRFPPWPVTRQLSSHLPALTTCRRVCRGSPRQRSCLQDFRNPCITHKVAKKDRALIPSSWSIAVVGTKARRDLLCRHRECSTQVPIC